MTRLTDTAQRRLLEALATMHDPGAGHTLTAFAFGVREMAAAMPDDEWPGVPGMYRALADLAEAVRDDLTEQETSE